MQNNDLLFFSILKVSLLPLNYQNTNLRTLILGNLVSRIILSHAGITDKQTQHKKIQKANMRCGEAVE